MSQLLAMTKTYLIDDYYECENKLFSGVHQNNNNLLINRCYHKIADFVTTNNQSINNNNNNNSDKRVRHYSQQQFANNNINQKLTISPDIDLSVSINSYETEEHVNYLSKKIETTLKEAKEEKKLNCTEILIPQMLTKRIAQDIIAMAETEPCGLRGCLLYLNIEEKTLCRRLGEIKLDKSSVPTFEMYLTLKRAIPSWIDAFENKLLRKESVVLSELYRLSKKKLYRTLSSP